MALTAGPTGTSQSTDGATHENAFNAAAAISSICVRCRSTAANPASVRITPLHGATGEAVILQGEREYFRVGHEDMPAFTIGGVGGATTVDWFGIADTR